MRGGEEGECEKNPSRGRERETEAGWRKITREANVLIRGWREREREKECAKSTNLPLFHLVLQLSVYLSIFLLLLSLSLSPYFPAFAPPILRVHLSPQCTPREEIADITAGSGS